MTQAWWWPEGSLAAAVEMAAQLRSGGGFAVADTVAGPVGDAARSPGVGPALEPVGSLPGRVLVEACTSGGRAVSIEFRVRLDTVEIACGGLVRAVFDRVELGSWLARPNGVIEVDDVVLGMDRLIDSQGRVTISVRRADVLGWALSPEDRAALSARV